MNRPTTERIVTNGNIPVGFAKIKCVDTSCQWGYAMTENGVRIQIRAENCRFIKAGSMQPYFTSERLTPLMILDDEIAFIFPGTTLEMPALDIQMVDNPIWGLAKFWNKSVDIIAGRSRSVQNGKPILRVLKSPPSPVVPLKAAALPERPKQNPPPVVLQILSKNDGLDEATRELLDRATGGANRNPNKKKK